ncbi:MAG: response regulator transcription factor [Chloroflexota bacterium]|nr:response regulator transcription factor [Chloroflexota bacterium]
MQPSTTLALVHSAHPPWDALRRELAAQPDLTIVGDVGPTQPLCDLAGRHPTVLLVTADLSERPPIPLVRDLSALSPASKIIMLGATATLDGAALITLHDQGIRGYLVWEELRPGTVWRALLLVVEDDVLVGSPIVLATLHTALERRREARVDGLVLTPAQRAAWTHSTADPPPLLTPRQEEVATLIAEGRGNREIETALHLTKSTVKTHVRTILRKCEVTTRAAFIAKYRSREEEG